eukprot:g31647.t1
MRIVANTKKKLREKLKSLKVDKSNRPDGLHPSCLKQIAGEIVEALVVIFQESLESERAPENWKMANATPLFKKGGQQKTRNYGLVFLTSVVDNILESIIKDEIAEYLEVC